MCRSTLDAVDADNCSFWRRRFLDYFEKPTTGVSFEANTNAAWNNVAYKKAYQKRRSALKNGAKFAVGASKRETECLEVLRDLVVGESPFLSSCRTAM